MNHLSNLEDNLVVRILQIVCAKSTNMEDFASLILANGSIFRAVYSHIYKRIKIVLHAREDTAAIYNFDYQLRLATFEIWNMPDAKLMRFFQCFGRHLKEITIEYESDTYNGAMPMFANVYALILGHCQQPDGTIHLNSLSLHTTYGAPPQVAFRINQLLDKVRGTLEGLGISGRLPGPAFR